MCKERREGKSVRGGEREKAMKREERSMGRREKDKIRREAKWKERQNCGNEWRKGERGETKKWKKEKGRENRKRKTRRMPSVDVNKYPKKSTIYSYFYIHEGAE